MRKEQKPKNEIKQVMAMQAYNLCTRGAEAELLKDCIQHCLQTQYQACQAT